MASAQTPRRHERSELLLDIVLHASSADSVDEVLDAICLRVAQAFSARRASAFLLDHGRLVPRMSRYADQRTHGREWEEFLASDRPFELGRRVLVKDGPVVISDTREVDDWWVSRFDVGAALGVPIGAPTDPIGVLVIDSSEPRDFSEEEVRFAAAIGANIGVFLARIRTSDERDHHLRVATALQHLLERGAGASSIRDASEIVARVAHEELGTEHAIGYLRDRDGTLRDFIAIDVPQRFREVIRERIIGAQIPIDLLEELRGPGVVAIEDVRDTDVLPQELVEALHPRSLLLLPILGSTGPIGFVECGTTRTVRRWSERDLHLAERLAAQGSLVVENAALREAEHRRLVELSHQAFHDALTGLPNRSLLLDRIEHALARHERNQQHIAILFVDLDRFKTVNDLLGHEAGDELLVEVAQRLEDCVRPADTVGRLAGDEFVVLLEDMTSDAEVFPIVERIKAALERPIVIGGQDVYTSASIGIAVEVSIGASAEELVRSADRAMYRAKRAGGSAHAVFDAELDGDVGRRLELEAELREAVARDELDICYQPIVELTSGRVNGVEALLRWRHPRLGTIESDKFIAIAEEIGQLAEIGMSVVDRATEAAAQWRRDGHDLDLHINVSPRQLFHQDLISRLESALRTTGLDPAVLVIELNEAIVAAHAEQVLERLAELRDLGVRVALDNFGSERTSLRSLPELPIQLVKIDRSFTSGIAARAGARELVRVILEISSTFGFDVIAEGIETDGERDALVSLGCERGQGFFFAAPLDVTGVHELLKDPVHSGSAPVDSDGPADEEISGFT